jgi:hypothetical protein
MAEDDILPCGDIAPAPSKRRRKNYDGLSNDQYLSKRSSPDKLGLTNVFTAEQMLGWDSWVYNHFKMPPKILVTPDGGVKYEFFCKR